MQIFVLIHDKTGESYTTLSATAKSAGISRETLRQHLDKFGKYDKNGLLIVECELNKVKGTGNRSGMIGKPTTQDY